MSLSQIIKFREQLRRFEQELDIQNTSNCCWGVTLAQCHVLMQLDKEDNITLKELSEKMNLDKSTLSRTTDKLVKLDLLVREIPEKNRRTVCLSLTNQGKSLCKKINEDNNNYFKIILGVLTDKDYVVFMNCFESITNKMVELNHNRYE